MNKILITGATGFTGGWIIKYLSEKLVNSKIIGTGRNIVRAKSMIKEGYQIELADLSTNNNLDVLFSEVDTVVHCAAKSSPWGCYNDFFADNVIATRNLLKLSNLTRIIYISTPSIYFDYSDKLNIKESDPLPKKMVNNYARTKYIAEQEVINAPKNIIQKVVLRPRAIIGAGDTTLMPRVIKAQEEKRLKIIGNGNNLVDFTSVKNLAHAVYLALLTHDTSKNDVYNITDDQSIKLWPILQETLITLGYKEPLQKIPYSVALFAAQLNETYHKLFSSKEPTLTKFGIGILNYSLTINIDLAKSKLGYKPIVTTKNSIDEFIEWYQRL